MAAFPNLRNPLVFWRRGFSMANVDSMTHERSSLRVMPTYCGCLFGGCCSYMMFDAAFTRHLALFWSNLFQLNSELFSVAQLFWYPHLQRSIYSSFFCKSLILELNETVLFPRITEFLIADKKGSGHPVMPLWLITFSNYILSHSSSPSRFSWNFHFLLLRSLSAGNKSKWLAYFLILIVLMFNHYVFVCHVISNLAFFRGIEAISTSLTTLNFSLIACY